ncbi:MAG TPA: aquaporin [Gemmatimonadales bacterium]|nr:aquaporin [Gemmatimonadales bacterium]
MHSRSPAEHHLREYLIEGALLGLFMISACAFTVLLEHPASPLHRALPDAFMRRLLIGLAMGGTAVALIYSPWGKQSGAHMNPAITLTFTRLGKVAPHDAAAYVAAQFAGGLSGVLLARLALRTLLAHPSVGYAATLPGHWGVTAAFVAEAAISCLLVLIVLTVSNHPRWAGYTGLCAGLLVATYITLEAPLSGMSMNPARTFASAFFGRNWTAIWLYFVAPPLGMLVGAELYLWRRGRQAVACAKLHHQNSKRCIFCEYQASRATASLPQGTNPSSSTL